MYCTTCKIIVFYFHPKSCVGISLSLGAKLLLLLRIKLPMPCAVLGRLLLLAPLLCICCCFNPADADDDNERSETAAPPESFIFKSYFKASDNRQDGLLLPAVMGRLVFDSLFDADADEDVGLFFLAPWIVSVCSSDIPSDSSLLFCIPPPPLPPPPPPLLLLCMPPPPPSRTRVVVLLPLGADLARFCFSRLFSNRWLLAKLFESFSCNSFSFFLLISLLFCSSFLLNFIIPS